MDGRTTNTHRRAQTGRKSRARTRLRRTLGALSAILLVWLGALDGAALATEAADADPGASASGPASVPASRVAPNLAVITIEGPIDAVTVASFERRLNRAVDGGADGIVVEINSPGGEVGAVVEICQLIKGAPLSNVIAWVNDTAFSGGAVIALACKDIVVAPGATMGDIGVIGGDPLGMSFFQGLAPTERAKGLAPILTEIIDSARANGYDEMLVQAFVTLKVELWWVRNTQTGQTYFITADEYRAVFGTEPPRENARISTPGMKAANAQSEAEGRGTTVEFDPEDAPSASVEQERELQPASPELDNETIKRIVGFGVNYDSTRPDFFNASPGEYELIEYALTGDTLLTLKQADLQRWGLANPNLTVSNDEELKQFMGATELRRLKRSWSETFVRFMTQGMSGLVVRAVLIIVFLMAMFMEMSMPGLGIPGAVALVALAGLVLPNMLIGAANWWTIAAVGGGVGLILIEIFVVPGFGVPGIAGLLMLFGGLVGTFANAGELFPGSGSGDGADLAWASGIVLMAVFIAGVGMFFFAKYTSRFPMFGKLVLADGIPTDDEATLLGAMAGGSESAHHSGVTVGMEGVASTPLRTSGTAEFDGRLVDVVSEVGFIEAGEAVRVCSVGRYRVGVEPAGGPPSHATDAEAST